MLVSGAIDASALFSNIRRGGVSYKASADENFLIALTALENVTSTSTSDSTSSSSSSSSASASTGTGSSSGAVQSATLSGGLAACAVIILVGMMIVS